MRTKGCRLLAAHLSRSDELQRDFAQRAGMSKSMLSHILAGRRRPTLDAALGIQEASGGAVPAPSWRGSEQEDDGRRFKDCGAEARTGS